MNLLPFNLEKALAGEKVVTIDERIVTDIHHLKNVNRYHQVFAVIDSEIFLYSIGGRIDSINDSVNDLFMAPKTTEIFFNVSETHIGFEQSTLNNCKSLVPIKNPDNFVSVCKLTICDGEIISHETVYKY